MSIQKDLLELFENGVISQETAGNITAYYASKGDNSKNRLFIVFGILGATLVGLGLILIIAHNWDDLSRFTKTILAFIPLIIGQLSSGYTILKKATSTAWRETSGVFLFFGIGASISMVSQIYNIPGDLSNFILFWMLLALPVAYLLKSSIASSFYIIGITYYLTPHYMSAGNEEFIYLGLLALILPYYYLLYKRNPYGNFINLHHLLIPISIMIALGSWIHNNGELMTISYFSLFGIFYLIGQFNLFEKQKLRNNIYKILGSLGTVILLLFLSFKEFWKELARRDFSRHPMLGSTEFIIATILSLVAIGLLINNLRKHSIREIKPITPVFLIFIALFILGMTTSYVVILINILLFGIGVMTIREGAKMDNLAVLNYGLLIITALVVSRFFDTDLSFVLRGLLFISVGIGFFLVNYWMLQKRKKNELQ